MIYRLVLHRERVVLYLRNHLSEEDQNRVFSVLNSGLRQGADALRADPQRRLQAGGSYFLFDVVLGPRHPGELFRHFWFVVDDSSASDGVLYVEYADQGNPPRP